MEDYGQIKINQYRTCMIIPFSYDSSFFGQMLQEKEEDYKEENKKKKNERDYSRFCFKEFFQKIQIRNSEPFSEKAKEWLVEKGENSNTEKLVLQCYEFRNGEREKINLNQKVNCIYTLSKQKYSFKIQKIKAWFFKTGQGFLTLELRSEGIETIKEALTFNSLRWVNRDRKFNWKKRKSKNEEKIISTNIKEILEKCLDSLKNIGVRNGGIMEDKAYFLSVLISDGNREVDNTSEVLQRLCLKYSVNKPIADAQKNAIELYSSYKYIWCGICGNTVAILGDCFKEQSEQKEQSNKEFMTVTYPNNIFSHYLITYLYYLSCYKKYQDLSDMLGLPDKINPDEIHIEKIGSEGLYDVLNDIFYNILCEKVWNLPDKINELKKEYKKYDIFISYRHDGGQYLALLLFEHLREKGLKVFLDVESLKVGHFDKQIYNEIESCKYLLFVVSPGCVKKLVEVNDWVAKELVGAVKAGCKILPVYMEGVSITDSEYIDSILNPEEEKPEVSEELKTVLKALPIFQSFEAKVGSFDSSVEKIIAALKTN